MEDYRHQKKKGLVLKLDLGKAYKDWDFLDYIMEEKALVVNGEIGHKVALNHSIYQ